MSNYLSDDPIVAETRRLMGVLYGIESPRPGDLVILPVIAKLVGLKGERMASQEYIDLLYRVQNRVPALIQDMKELHEKKNAGYAGRDNPDPWANFRIANRIGLTALQGCMTRWGDKIIRVENVMQDSSNEQVGESLEDTLMDLAAYSLIAICLLREDKK